MKINIMSDLHLEFADLRISNEGNADVLILSGDICVAAYMNKSKESPYFEKGQRFIAFFEHAASLFKKVFYVKGNHESYQGRYNLTTDILREKLGHIENLSILDRQAELYEDVLFYGATIWTDLSDPMDEFRIKNGLNDYRLIQIEKPVGLFRKLIPQDTTKEHFDSRMDIRSMPMLYDKVVVIGHHAPSSLSVNDEYRNHPLNAGYYSDLSSLMRPEIVLWTHGHMHHTSDYEINGTRVVANPRGYNGENKDFKIEYTVEI